MCEQVQQQPPSSALLSHAQQRFPCDPTGVMFLGCSMVTTGLPLMLTAGVTGALPGGTNSYPSSSQAGLDLGNSGRVLLSDGGAAAPDPGLGSPS